MEQGASWKADSRSAVQGIPLLLQNMKVHYRVHNSMPPVPILSQNESSPPPISGGLSYLRLGLLSCLFPSCFPTKIL
jgi:hypothetical protein